MEKDPGHELFWPREISSEFIDILGLKGHSIIHSLLDMEHEYSRNRVVYPRSMNN